MRVVIVPSLADRSSWKNYEVPDLFELLRNQWTTFPETARIYHKVISKENDVTPGSEDDCERLKAMPGPFFVVVYPEGPALIIVGAILFAVAAVALSSPTIPSLPTPVVARNQQTASPNNELSDRSNRARINGRIPDIFGQVKATPDLISAPYKIFEANREVEYAYMCVGRGFYEIEEVRDGETLCANIPGTSIEIYEPFTSPNSGDVPQIRIGSAINSRVLATKRSNSVNGQVLRPPNAASITGIANMIFRYPGSIQYSVSSGDIQAFSSQFAEGDLLTITGAAQAEVSASLLGSYTNIVGTLSEFPPGIPSMDPAFVVGGFITFAYPPGSPITPPAGMEVGNTITLTQAVDPAVSDYHVSSVVLEEWSETVHVTGANANLSGVYTIAAVAVYVGANGAPVFSILLDDPASVNSNWDLYSYGITIYGVGTNANRMGIALGHDTPIPSFDLDGSYTIVAVTPDTIILDDPASVNSDWNILDTIPGDSSPPLSPTLSVSGQRWIGPFVLDEEESIALYANFVASNGLYKDDGTDQIAASIEVMVEVTPIDETDTARGAPETVSVILNGSATLKETVAYTLYQSFVGFVGRFSIRASRITEADSTFEGQVIDEVRWRDVYSVAPVSDLHFGNVTTVHSKTYATASALAVKERKLTMLATRKLPARVGETSEFTDTVLVPTLNAADIFCAICRDLYIGNRSIAEIDVSNIYNTVEQVETYFGHIFPSQFCYTFDNDNLSFEETATLVALALHCVAYRRGSVIKLSFEEETEDSTLLFNHRNKIPRSEAREFNFGFSNDNDGVQFTYVDPVDDSIISVFLPESYPSINPKKIESIGVRNHLQAYFLAWRAWNKIRYQNVGVRFDATQEADLLLRNDRILVTDSTRQGAQDGEVTAIDALELTLSQEVDLTVYDTYSVFLQHVDGSVETISCIAGTDPNQIILDDAPSQTLVTDKEAYARTTFILVGDEETQQLAFLVTEKEPVDKMISTVTAINYDARYYQNDEDFIDDVIGEGGYGGGGGFVPSPTTPPYTPGAGDGGDDDIEPMTVAITVALRPSTANIYGGGADSEAVPFGNVVPDPFEIEGNALTRFDTVGTFEQFEIWSDIDIRTLGYENVEIEHSGGSFIAALPTYNTGFGGYILNTVIDLWTVADIGDTYNITFTGPD